MILLIRGYGGNLDKMQRDIISNTLASCEGRLGEYTLKEINIEEKDIERYLKGVKVAYMDLKIPKQGEIGKSLESVGIKVMDYEVRTMHKRQKVDKESKSKKSIYLLRDKIEQDKAQNFKPREYTKITFSYEPTTKGYKVKIEDVLELDYEVQRKERQGNGEIRYASSKREYKQIIEDYKRMHKKKVEDTDHYKAEEKEGLEKECKINIQKLERGYNEGVR